MDASQLREWIAIFQMELTPDGQGGSRETVPPGLAADRPANVRTPSPRRVFSGDQRADRVQYAVTIRFQDWVTTSYRVMFKDQFLDIVGVANPEERNEWLELTCERLEAGRQ